MKKLLLCGVLFLPFLSHAQNKEQNEKGTIKLDSIVVEAYRAGKNTPVSYTRIRREELLSAAPSNSIPMLLSLTPSVVSSTEGGNGLGYSSMRIRGSEGSRINVTLNGIALNEAESQEVFWVNIPSFSSFLQDVQVQRGVGTSSNGSAAFGASINMRTLSTASEPYGNAEFSVGSYGTFMSTIGAGTGYSKSGLSADFRFSRNMGEGYIRNAKTDLISFFGSLGWYNGKSSVRINYILGDQKSGITWAGISREQMEKDRKFNPAGTYYDAAGNVHYYDNETDNYRQHHIQAHFITMLKPSLSLSATAHYTKGDGYYENYKANRKFSDYGLSAQVVRGVSYSRSDMIVQKAMDNHYLAFNTNLQYNTLKFKGSAGMSVSLYSGDHFGNVIWSMYNESIAKRYRWYDNNGNKSDVSAFAKGEYTIGEALTTYLDMQYRRIDYKLLGADDDIVALDWSRGYNFFNPKAGLTLSINKSSQLYASVAVGRKEPGRADIKEAVKADKADDINPERLLDYELGYRLNGENFNLSANIYLMEYKDQLVSTGRLSSTGYVIKENVDKSYRRGVEISAAWRPVSLLRFDGNITLSKNVIRDYVAFVDQYDNENDWNPLPQREYVLDKTTISFSPSLTGMAMATIYPSSTSSLSFDAKYVGKQYIDNMESEDRSIPAYYLLNFRASKTFGLRNNRYMDVQFFVNNLLNRKYFSNGWVYFAQFATGNDYIEEGVYPQAEINFMLRVALRF